MYSSLAKGIIETPNKTKRTVPIDSFCIHHMAGFMTGKQCATTFSNPGRQASANYCIGKTGVDDVWCSCPEEYRAWTSGTGNVPNGDQRMITFELANDSGAPDWHVSDATIEACIQVCVDVCQRYGIPEVKWSDDKETRKTQKNYLYFHCDWQATACPGPYLKKKIPEYIIPEINRRLGNKEPSPIKKEYNNKEEFVEVIAKYVKEIAPKFDIKVASPIIAQAILESGYGTSYKAQFNNFFGLKYRPGRVTCNISTITDGGSEQKADGSYVNIETSWYVFKDVRDGVQGYFEFTNIERYSNLKNVYDPYEYLRLIKEDGYATSLSYVDNLTRVIKENNLERFDSKEQPKEVVYTVQKGDTLSNIARRFGTTWTHLAEINNLKNPNLIFPGQVLYIIK